MAGEKRRLSGGESPAHKAARSEYMRNHRDNRSTDLMEFLASSGHSSTSMAPPSQSPGRPQSTQPPLGTEHSMPQLPPSETSQSAQVPASEPLMSSQPSVSSAHVSTPNLSQLPTSPPRGYAQATLRLPSPGLQDTSNITYRTVSDVSETEKSQWRAHTDARAFFGSTGWNMEHLPTFLRKASDDEASGDTTFTEWILEKATEELSVLKLRLGTIAGAEKIRWERIFGDNQSYYEDDLVYVWIRVKKVDYRLRKSKGNALVGLLRELLPRVRQVDVNEGYDVAAKAFYAEEKPTADGHRPSDDFCTQLLQSFDAYDPQSHLSPYLSIVGPSGIGKSFMVQQMAVRHGIYVLYISFARLNSGAYPSRSVIASMIPKNATRDQLFEFWSVFIETSLAVVEGCREVGITATGLYNLQAKDYYEDHQREFTDLVFKALSKRRGSKNDKKPSVKDAVLESLESRDTGRLGPMHSWCDVLDRNGDNQQPVMPESVAQKTTPSVLFCFDEARELIDDQVSLKFRSLREALGHCFDRSSLSRYTGLPRAAFFAVFLDTNSKITNFSPPAHSDDSQKALNPTVDSKKLLPPIYAIDTTDVFRDPNFAQQPQDGSYEAALKLFQLARPLWGSRRSVTNENNASRIVKDILELAKRKTEGNSVAKTLAFMSYRLQFYVTSNQVTEQMVASCMRYVLYINPARDMMRTIHPSEPVLAHTSQLRMIDPVNRLHILQQFVTSCFEGSIDAGDIGEMVASLVLMFAYDETLFKPGMRSRRPTPLALSDFMASLLGEEQRDSMAERASTDSDMKKLWDGGLVFFNHFVRAKRDPQGDLVEGVLERAYERGAAVFLRDNFPGIDLIIPIMVPDGDMTFLAVQVKNRKDDNARSEIKNTASWSMKRATDKLNWKRAHIGIMMCLRHDGSPTERFHLLKPEPKRTTAGSASRRRQGSHTSDMSSQYQWSRNKELLVMTLGVDELVFPSINSCQGNQTDQSRRVAPLLERVLDCVPGISLPEDAHFRYTDRLMFS